MLDFIELGLDIKYKIKIYISSTQEKQTTTHSGRQNRTSYEFYDKDTYQIQK